MTKEDYAQMPEAMRKRTVAEPQNAAAWRDLASCILWRARFVFFKRDRIAG